MLRVFNCLNHAACCYLSVSMLSVAILSVSMLSVVILNLSMLSVVMLSIALFPVILSIVLCVVMPSIAILSIGHCSG